MLTSPSLFIGNLFTLIVPSRWHVQSMHFHPLNSINKAVRGESSSLRNSHCEGCGADLNNPHFLCSVGLSSTFTDSRSEVVLSFYWNANNDWGTHMMVRDHTLSKVFLCVSCCWILTLTFFFSAIYSWVQAWESFRLHWHHSEVRIWLFVDYSEATGAACILVVDHSFCWGFSLDLDKGWIAHSGNQSDTSTALWKKILDRVRGFHLPCRSERVWRDRGSWVRVGC